MLLNAIECYKIYLGGPPKNIECLQQRMHGPPVLGCSTSSRQRAGNAHPFCRKLHRKTFSKNILSIAVE